MKSVYVAISSAVVKLSIDDEIYEKAVAEALADYENTIDSIHKLLSMLCTYVLATVDFSSSGHPKSKEIRNRIDDRSIAVAIAALWRYNMSVTTERDALLVVGYDKSRRGVVTHFTYDQFNGAVKPDKIIELRHDREDQELATLQPRVYVRIGTTNRSPVIGVMMKKGRTINDAAVAIADIEDTDDAIERHMMMLGQYASAFYYCYIAKDKDAEQMIKQMRTDMLAVSILLLERFARNRKPDGVPILEVAPKNPKKAPINGFQISVLPKPPIPPELQAAFTLGDPEDRILN